MKNSLVTIIEKAAPLLAEAIGGPMGGVAGILTSVIANTFGAKDTDIQDVISKIQADPNAAEKLKELEIKHQDFILQTKAANLDAEYQDTQSARSLEENYELRTGKMNPMLPFLVVALFGSLGGIIYCLLIYTTTNAPLLTILTVIATKLSAKLEDVYDLYFGGTSDNDSAKK